MEDKWPRGPLHQERYTMRKTSCWIWVLCIYAGTVSGAFIGVTVLGVLQLNKLSAICDFNQADSEIQTPTSNIADGLNGQQHDNNNEVKRYTLDDDHMGTTELIEIDIKNGKATFYFPGTIETQSGVAAIDYHAHVGGLHISGGKDRCYLVQDMDRYFPDLISLHTFLEMGTKKVGHRAVVTLDFEIYNHGDPEGRLDSIPRELHNLCWGKTIYWLKQVSSIDDLDSNSREVIAVVTTHETTIFIGIRE